MAENLFFPHFLPIHEDVYVVRLIIYIEEKLFLFLLLLHGSVCVVSIINLLHFVWAN